MDSKSTKTRVEAKSRPTDAHRREYERRVNRVIDHIRANLAKELTLERLADIAAFSPFQFHRIFIAVTGETLNDFVRRVRLERAASALLVRPHMNVIDVALNYGFSSPAAFARAFKTHFGMSASQWRSGGAEKWSGTRASKNRNFGKVDRKVGKAGDGGSWHRSSPTTGTIAMQVTVKELPTFRVAYMRNVGPYGAHLIPGLWKRLHQWMAPRDWRGSKLSPSASAYDPRVVAPEKCRYDACVVVPDNFRDNSIDFKHIAGERCAITPFVGTAEEIGAMWDRFLPRMTADQRLPARRSALSRDPAGRRPRAGRPDAVSLRALPAHPGDPL